MYIKKLLLTKSHIEFDKDKYKEHFIGYILPETLGVLLQMRSSASLIGLSQDHIFLCSFLSSQF